MLERWGRIDVLVNSAGVARHALFKDEDPETFVRLMETNYLGVVWAIRAVLPAMRARGEGWIVNVSSVAGKLGQPDESAYSASKFAVTGLSEALAYELEPLGIHVMTVYPALVRTEMFTPDVLARMPERVKRTFIEPADFTRAVFRGLARGAHEVTVPRYVEIAYLMRLLLPGALPPHDGGPAAPGAARPDVVARGLREITRGAAGIPRSSSGRRRGPRPRRARPRVRARSAR